MSIRKRARLAIVAIHGAAVLACRREITHLKTVSSPAREDRILIVAPHIDDEVIGAGGYAVDALRNGSAVAVVYLTAGDCNLIPAMIDDRRLIPRPADFLQEGRDRIREGLAAMQSLGVPRRNVYLLGYPDRGLKLMLQNPAQVVVSRGTGKDYVPYADAMSPHAPHALSNLVRDLGEVLREFQPNLIIVPVTFDRHPDHAAAPALLHMALRTKTRTLSYLVHAHHFPSPFRYAPNASLEPPALFTNDEWATYPLARVTEHKKLEILRMYRTQRKDPHLYLLTEAVVRRNELFVVEQ